MTRRWLMLRAITFIALLFAVLPAPPLHAEDVLAGRVLRVIDGDTLDVLLASGRIRVRLHGVDAPERDQPGGRDAQRWLQQRVQDRQVLVEPVSQDRYERMVAVVHLDQIEVNAELLRAGQAWAYRRYLRIAERGYCDLEFAARTARLGLWAATPAQAPWEFRRTGGRGPFTDYSGQTAAQCWRSRREP